MISPRKFLFSCHIPRRPLVTERKLTLTDDESGKSIDLPVVTGSEGDPALDISGLNPGLGYFTFDPGFGATASCASDITYIDGEAGVLLYRGYPKIGRASRRASGGAAG